MTDWINPKYAETKRPFKCMFCECETSKSIACDDCWQYIVEANVTVNEVFSFEEQGDNLETIDQLKEWVGLGEQLGVFYNNFYKGKQIA